MNPSRREFLKHSAKVFDLGVLVCAFVLASIAYLLPKGFTLTGLMALRVTLGNCLLFAVLLVTWHNLFILCGLYKSKRLTGRRAEMLEVLKATVLASAFLVISAKLFHMKIVTFSFVLVFWISCAFLMAVGRLAARSLLLALRRRGKNGRFMLIVGTNERAIDFARRIMERPELGYQI